jgi:hypothetical protein
MTAKKKKPAKPAAEVVGVDFAVGDESVKRSVLAREPDVDISPDEGNAARDDFVQQEPAPAVMPKGFHEGQWHGMVLYCCDYCGFDCQNYLGALTHEQQHVQARPGPRVSKIVGPDSKPVIIDK